jgi:hypothetical protein
MLPVMRSHFLLSALPSCLPPHPVICGERRDRGGEREGTQKFSANFKHAIRSNMEDQTRVVQGAIQQANGVEVKDARLTEMETSPAQAVVHLCT